MPPTSEPPRSTEVRDVMAALDRLRALAERGLPVTERDVDDLADLVAALFEETGKP